MNAIRAQIAQSQRAEFHSLLEEMAGESDELDAPTRTALSAWDGHSDPVLPASEEALRGVVHAAYLAACEAIGPSRADRGLSQAIKRVEDRPEAIGRRRRSIRLVGCCDEPASLRRWACWP